MQLQNDGAQTFRDPVLLVVKNLSSLDVNALRPDGLTPAGHPYFRMASSNGTLTPGQISLARQLGFLNSSNARFDYEVQILAAVNSAPGNFVSTPLTSIEAGDVYRYNRPGELIWMVMRCVTQLFPDRARLRSIR